jgi:hypothetical protein
MKFVELNTTLQKLSVAFLIDVGQGLALAILGCN